MLHFLFAFLTGASSFAAAQPSSPPRVAQAANCSTKIQTLVSHMPPVRSQDTTPYCYGFAPDVALQQLKCKKANLETCSNDISVLDLLKSGNAGAMAGLGNGGYAEELLRRVKGQKVAPETCAPFAPVVNSGRITGYLDPRKFYSITKWKTITENTFAHAHCEKCGDIDVEKVSKDLKDTLKLSVDLAQIADALKMPSYELFLEKLLIPESCKDQRTALPDFATIQERQETDEGIRKVLLEQNAKDRPVIAFLCANGSNNDVSKWGVCVSHYLNISGNREICCDGICHYEYRLHDTGNTYMQRDMSEDYWVTESDLFERIKRKQSPHPNLIWLEGGP